MTQVVSLSSMHAGVQSANQMLHMLYLSYRQVTTAGYGARRRAQHADLTPDMHLPPEP
jgi:hypothetical protein